MMAKFSMLICFLLVIFITKSFAFPATDEEKLLAQQATQNELFINLPIGEVSNAKNSANTPGNILKTTTEEPITYPSISKSEGSLSRLVGDVFQIPITVLQSVSRLLTNTFSPKRL